MRLIKSLLLILFGMISSLTFAEDTQQFILSSPVVFNNGHLPALYTCDGKDISPKLVWFHAPAKTQTFALIVADPDAPAGTFYHWVLYNIPGTAGVIDKAATSFPAGTLIGMNSAKTSGYFGPCPPKGPEHHYVFTWYALDAKLDLAAGADAAAVLAGMQTHILSQVEMTALYGR